MTAVDRCFGERSTHGRMHGASEISTSAACASPATPQAIQQRHLSCASRSTIWNSPVGCPRAAPETRRSSPTACRPSPTDGDIELRQSDLEWRDRGCRRKTCRPFHVIISAKGLDRDRGLAMLGPRRVKALFCAPGSPKPQGAALEFPDRPVYTAAHRVTCLDGAIGSQKESQISRKARLRA